MRCLWKVVVVGLVLLVYAGSAQASSARVRVAHLSPDAPAVDGHPCVARQQGQIGVNCKLFQQQGDEIALVPVNEQFAIQRFPTNQLLWARRVLYSVRLQ